MQSHTPISAVIITHNEAFHIEACLAGLTWADEVLVVDSGSTDGTEVLARAAGARVIHHDFAGFGPQKNYAVSAAKYDWVLVIDADERLSPELQVEIQTLQTQGLTAAGYRIYRDFIFLNRLMKHGGEGNKSFLRLFNRQRGNFNLKQVHEDVVINGQTLTLNGRLLHYSYKDLADYVSRLNRYTSAGAQDKFNQGKDVSVGYLWFRQHLTFWQYYLLKGFWRDGYPGFVWSLLSSYYPVIKYMKLRELRQATSQGRK